MKWNSMSNSTERSLQILKNIWIVYYKNRRWDSSGELYWQSWNVEPDKDDFSDLVLKNSKPGVGDYTYSLGYVVNVFKESISGTPILK